MKKGLKRRKDKSKENQKGDVLWRPRKESIKS
jgi:hypothetical protein